MSISLGVAAVLEFATWGGHEVFRPGYEGSAGIAYGSTFAPIRDQEIDFHIWYPASPGGKAVTVGGNGVFFGTQAGRGAPHREGRFPLVLISHGAGGNAGQFGWIASQLAEAGYVFVLPNHPGTTTGNASAEAAVQVWERPKDISAVLDSIFEDPADYPYINTSKVSVLGFSAGGYTAMALAGARVDPDRLQAFCDDTDLECQIAHSLPISASIYTPWTWAPPHKTCATLASAMLSSLTRASFKPSRKKASPKSKSRC